MIQSFPHYQNIESGITKEEQFVQGADFVNDERDLSLMNDEFTSLIFAPDPVTGIPRSDLAVIMSKDTAPEIAQYIQSHFQSPLPSSPGVDDPDVAIDGIKRPGESIDQYAERLRQIVSSVPKPKSE